MGRIATDSYGRVYTELVRLRLVVPEQFGDDGSSSDSGEVLVCCLPGSRFLRNPAKDVAFRTRFFEKLDPPPPLSDPLEYSGLSVPPKSSRMSVRDASRITFETMVHSLPVLGMDGSIFSLWKDLDLVGGRNTSSPLFSEDTKELRPVSWSAEQLKLRGGMEHGVAQTSAVSSGSAGCSPIRVISGVVNDMTFFSMPPAILGVSW